MKRRILCFVLTMAMVLSVLVVVPAVSVSADSNTISVGTKAELEAIATANNDGSVDYSGKTVVLTADIDLSGSNWTSIGNSTYPFKGSFDGQGHTISGMTRSGGAIGQNVGLFGVVSSPDGGSTTIQNFKLGGSIVSSNGGENAGMVISAVKPSETGTTQVSITGIWSTVNFDASAAKMIGVGGILGTIAWCTSDYEVTVNIDSCRYSGTLNSPSAGSNDYGGIMGYPKEAASPRTVNITNCIFDGSIILYGSTPDDNGGIVGYFKGNGGTQKQTNIYISNCIVAGKFEHKNTTSQTVTGYVVSEYSGANASYAVTNVYYCDDSDRHTGGAMGGWYGYMKGGSTDPTGITKNNVTAKTMTQLQAMTSGFADDSKWHFYNNGSDLPIPAMIYDNIIATTPATIFDDLSQSTFTITTADELMQFASIVNAGTSQFQGKTVYLGADIDLTGYTWQSIGKTRGGGSTTFRGTFDGQGHTISNMTSTVNNADGEGGLFGYVVYDATIRNFKLTGTITATGNNANGSGYFGSVIGCAFQTTATINLSNIWSSVNISCSNSGARGIAIGGLVGQIRSASNMGTLTLNIDSCVYDGAISDGNRFDCVGGFIGRTHDNASGRPLNLTISNSVFAGSIHVNDIYSEDISCIIGYIKGNGSGGGAVNVTITNVISTGRVFFYTGDTREWAPTTKCVGGILSSEITGTVPVVTVTNLYYKNFQVPVGAANTATWQDTALYFNTPSCSVTVTGGGKKTTNEMLALTTSSFTASSKWNKTDDYYPCPKNIVDSFGLPTSLYVENTDINVGTAAALNALATAVNNGTTYAGKTIHITDDIVIESGWTSIGITSSKPFMGNFNGHGHTIEINQTLSNPDGVGGLIAFSRTPAGGTVTIENLHLTGRIDANNTNTGSGYFGGLTGCVDGNTSGAGGTINFKNVWNSLYINCGNTNMWTGVGGFIGFVRHADGLKPLEINFDSCIWDGTLNVGPAAYYFGGFIGYTGNNKAGRTLTINIANSVAVGKAALNIDWNQYIGLLVGYAKGSNSDAATAKVTINVNDVVSSGKMTFRTGTPGTGSKIGHIAYIDGTTELNMTNLYYNAFERGAMTGNAPALDSGTANTSTNVVATTAAGFGSLTTAAFTDASKWNKSAGYTVCPAGIVDTFGDVPESMENTASDVVTIDSVAALLEFRDAVNSGNSYAGKLVKLTKDIDLDVSGTNGENEWVEIGRGSANAFSGTFDGDGHTINLASVQHWTTGYIDTQGGLFGHLNGAIVKNLVLTGSMDLHNQSTHSGTSDYFGSVAGAVQGVTKIQNVKSSVYISTHSSKNSNNGYPSGTSNVAGLVGFIPHNATANITIENCEYSGTINAGNQAINYAGIMANTGNGGTKSVTITGTKFSGRMTLNENSAYAFEGVAGFFSRVGSGTVTITNSHFDGRIYFNTTKAWPTTRDNNPVMVGQIIGYVNQSNNADTGSVVLDDTVTYIPAKLYTAAGTDEANKYVLPEIGRINGVYGGNGANNSAAVVDGMESAAAAAGAITVGTTSYNGVRFTATIYNTGICTGGGTKNANFGVFLLTKNVYDLFGGKAITYSELVAAATASSPVVQIKATKYENADAYNVCAVVYNLQARQTTELVAIPYAAGRLGNAVITTYAALYN